MDPQLAALSGQLDHVDGLIAAGVIRDERPNAGDFQIATSARVLLDFPSCGADRTVPGD